MKTFSISIPVEKYDVALLRRDMEILSFKCFIFEEGIKRYISLSQSPFSLETVHENGLTTLYITALDSTIFYLQDFIYLMFPNAKLEEVPDPLFDNEGYETVRHAEVGLKLNSVVASKTFMDLQVGSMDPILGIQTRFPKTTRSITQLVCQPIKDSTKKHIDFTLRRGVEHMKELLRFRKFLNSADYEDKWKRTLDKNRSASYRVSMRMAVMNPAGAQADEGRMLRNMLAGYSEMSYQELNGLKFIEENTGWEKFKRFQDRDHNKSFYMSTIELTTAWHPPVLADAYNLKKNLFHQQAGKGWLFQTPGQDGGVVCARNQYRMNTRGITLSYEDKKQSIHIIGAPETGKSTFLTQLITRDISKKRPGIVIDSQGVIEPLLRSQQPKPDLKDVLILDFTNPDHLPCINPLVGIPKIVRPAYASKLASLISDFGDTDFPDDTAQLLCYSILTLMQVPGGCVALIPLFLTDTQLREELLSTCSEQSLLQYWSKFYKLQYKSGDHPAVSALCDKIDQLLTYDSLRLLFSLPVDKCDFKSLLDQKKTILVKSQVGEANGVVKEFVLSLVIQKILAQLTTHSSEQVEPCLMYYDMPSETMLESVLPDIDEKRKYIRPIITRSGLPNSPEIRSLLQSTFSMHVCFRLAMQDAQFYETLFKPVIDPVHLTNVPNRNFYMKGERAGRPLDPTTGSTLDFNTSPKSIVADSLSQYSDPTPHVINRAEAEEIATMWQPQPPKDNVTPLRA